MKHSHEITVNRKKFPSIRQAAIADGLDYRIVHSRLKSGKTIKEAFSKDNLKKTGNSKKITIEGKKFNSRQDAADYYKIPQKTLSDRINRGLKPEEAVGLISFQPKNCKSISVNGKTYPSINSAAVRNSFLIYRLR